RRPVPDGAPRRRHSGAAHRLRHQRADGAWLRTQARLRVLTGQAETITDGGGMGQNRGGRAVALLLLAAAVAPTAGARAETLADAMAAAVLSSPELVQARANVKVQAERA